MTQAELSKILNRMDHRMIYESMQALASEGILQGSLNAKHGTPIDNGAIRDRVAETMTLIVAEISVAKIFEDQSP